MAVKMEWHVWEFPDNVRVYFNNEFRLELFRLLKGSGSRNKLAKKFGVSTSIIKAYFQKGVDSGGLKTYIPVRIIKKIPQIIGGECNSEFMLRLERNVVAYRARAGWAVKNPILPIRESPETYSIVSHMICDGTAGKGKTPCYYNTCKELREEFIRDLQIFGNVETNEYIVLRDVYAVLFPKAITDILSHIFEVEFVRTPNLPLRLLEAPNECKYAAIRAMFDDEGTIKPKGQITFFQKESGIIKGLKVLLDSIGIRSGKACTDNSSCGYMSVLSESREKFMHLIDFTHPLKRARLREVVVKDKIRQENKPLADKINELFLMETNLTKFEISKKLNANLYTVNEVLRHLRNEGKLKSKLTEINKPYTWSKV